jgi:hypothetical protein
MSTTTLTSQIEIDAPPAAVWDVLTDSAAHASWNPFVRKLEGELRPGAKLEVRIAPPDARPMGFKPTVLVVTPERELRWLGRFLAPGIFDGEHSFMLEPLPGGRTRFVQTERFSGILVRAFARTLAKTQLGFDEMNAALKNEAEHIVRNSTTESLARVPMSGTPPESGRDP